jgi:Beta-galactosidase
LSPRYRPVVLLALLVVLALPATSFAAKRKVPFGFFGTVVSHELSNPVFVSDAALDQQMALMASSGVESVRAPLTWAELEPAPGVYNWTISDRLAAAAARYGIKLLVNISATPQWASSQPNAKYPYRYPPANPRRFADFMRQLVLRYGQNGTFWAANPGTPSVPIRHWQIWNEQMAPWMWAKRPWPSSYVRMLKPTYRAIHQADRRAKVVAGSLVAYAGYAQWDGMRDLYRANAKGAFDEIAVHPFTNNPRSVNGTVDQTVEIIRRVRTEMRRRGDGRKPIIITELTWPAAIGKVPKRRLLGLETTTRGQVARLKASYRRLARVRRQLKVTQAYWFSWATEYDANSLSPDVPFRFAGLNRFSDGVFSPVPLLDVYARTAARYEGCRKGNNARVCR